MSKWPITQRFPITGRGWVFIFDNFPFDGSIKKGTRFIDQKGRHFEVSGIELFGPISNCYCREGIQYGKSIGVLLKPIGEYDNDDPVIELSIENV